MSPCPTLEALASMVSGRLSEADAARIEAHVEECETCETILDQLIAGREEESNSSGDRNAIDEFQFPHIPDYEIESVLGRGGMAVVYKARRTETCRPVAIKVLTVGTAPTERDHRNWLREARSLSRVPSHPNIVQFYNADRHDGYLFLVLELVEGGTLRDRLDGPLPPRIAARLMEQVARAVAHIHEAKLQHLDIKPSNVLLDGRPGADWSEVNPRLADFGIARLDSSARTGDTVTVTVARRGTPQYMAPEQFEPDHAALGPATDVYGLGATMYHLLTGRAPFRSANAALMHALVRSEPPVSPRRHHRAIPRDLETICLTCLKKNPAERYASATALAEDLARWRNGFPIQARPVPAHKHLWQACRRRPGVATLMSLVFLMVLMNSVGFYVRRSQFQAEKRHYQKESNELDVLIDSAEASYQTGRIPHSVILLLETGRSRQLGLLIARPDDSNGRRRLEVIDRLLAKGYRDEGKDQGAFDLVDEAIVLPDKVAAHEGKSTATTVAQIGALMAIGESGIAIHGSKTIASFVEGWCKKVDEVVSTLLHSDENRKSLIDIAIVRNRMALSLAMRGDVLPARKLLQSNRTMLVRLPTSLSSNDEIKLAVARSSILLGQSDDFKELVGIARRAQPGSEITANLLFLLATDAMIAIGWIPDLNESPRLPFAAAQEEPSRWAERFLEHLEARQAEISLGHIDIPETIYLNIHIIEFHFQILRTGGFGVELQRDTERFRSLADLLVHRYPRNSWSHVLLSEANVQLAKNESRQGNPGSLERLQKAIEEARTGLSLEPTGVLLAKILEDRIRRYDRYKADLEADFPGVVFPDRDGPSVLPSP